MSTIAFVKARIAHEQRESDDDPDRDTWTTPRWFTRRLGRVWLDPCSNAFSKVDAERTFRLDRGQDGLELAKHVPRNPPGIVFINPPYSRGMVIKFVSAYAATRFCFLLRFDPSTDWFKLLQKHTGAIVVPNRRINFDPPPGLVVATDNHNNPFPHAAYFRDLEDVPRGLRDISLVLRPER